MNDSEAREVMSPVDKAWLRMDSPTNLMIINGILLFDEVLDFATFKTICEQRLVGVHARFRQRVIESPPGTGRLYWASDPHFDIRSHLSHIALPAPGDKPTLQALISNLMSGVLDPHKPLWHFYLIENVGTGCAIFARCHHAIADGIALVQVLLSLTDSEPDVCPSPFVSPKRRANQAKRAPTLLRQVQQAQKLVKGVAKSLLYEGIQAIENPTHLRELVQAAGVMGAAGAAIIAKLLIMLPDRASILKGELGTTKRVVWSEPIDLEQVRAIGKATNTTINDVLVAAMAGALRAYLQAHGDPVTSGEMRAMVPINLRPQDEALTLGNQFSLVYLPLPVSLATPLERLQDVKRRMDLLKNSPEPLVIYQILNLVGMLPGELAERAVHMFASKATAVLTNVPGPRQTLYLAGKPMRRILCWVPQSGKIGLGISIVSYAGSVTLGLVVDEKLVQDPEAIMAQFEGALAELMVTATDCGANKA